MELVPVAPVRLVAPVVLPIATVPVPVVAIVTLEAPVLARSVVPVEVKVVNLPVLAVVAPIGVEFIEAKLAAPAPVMFHWASCRAKSEPEEAPMVIVPPAELPMVVLAVPEVLMVVVPVREVVPEIVRPELPVIKPADVMVPVPVVEILPEVVTASPAVAGCKVVPDRVQ